MEYCARRAFSVGTQAMLVAALVALVGCSNNGRHDLSGTITFNGQPVPLGEIRFEPDMSRGADGPGVLLPIENGVFRTTPSMGVVAGPHKVFIRGFDGKGAPAKQSGPAPYVGSPLFPEYTTTVDLPARSHVLNIDVPKP
jgi:hypothetical protein